MKTACPVCATTHRQGKPAFVLVGSEVRPAVVCLSCHARGVVLVVPEQAATVRVALAPWATHLRKLALVFETNGDDGRAAGLVMGAEILEAGRAVRPESSTALEPVRAFQAAFNAGAVGPLPPTAAAGGRKTARALQGALIESHPPPPPPLKTNGAAAPLDASSPSPCERAILAVLARYGGVHLPRTEIAIRACYKATSGGFDKALRRLVARKLIMSQSRGAFMVTAMGRAEASRAPEILPTGVALLRFWTEREGPCDGAVLEYAATHPGEHSRGELAMATHKADGTTYSPTSGGFDKSLRRLRRSGLLTKRNAATAELLRAIGGDS